ncbi:hypothetical protein ACTXT7_016854 [Hymenolepis weldensis]
MASPQIVYIPRYERGNSTIDNPEHKRYSVGIESSAIARLCGSTSFLDLEESTQFLMVAFFCRIYICQFKFVDPIQAKYILGPTPLVNDI